jgi:hypothetical protein
VSALDMPVVEQDLPVLRTDQFETHHESEAKTPIRDILAVRLALVSHKPRHSLLMDTRAGEFDPSAVTDRHPEALL